MNKLLFPCALGILTSCAPLRTSPHDEKHQWELKLHEVQTHLDDIKHHVACFQTELEILDGRIKFYENALTSLKQQDIEKQQIKIEQISQELLALEKKWSKLAKGQEEEKEDLHRLISHANDTKTALLQFKGKMQEFEQDLIAQDRRFEELGKIKGSIDLIAKSLKLPSLKTHKVRAGDTLEKIASAYHTKVDLIKKYNDLNTDLIVVGQELRIPSQ